MAPTACDLPLDDSRVRALVEGQPFAFDRASIREMNSLVDAIEGAYGIQFVRMEFGVPGLPTPQVAIDAEVRALRDGSVTSTYAPFEGLPELKAEASRFARSFMDVDVPADCCFPTIGAMEGCFAALALAKALGNGRSTVLCLEPGFPVNKLQLRLLGLDRGAIDLHNHRGADLIGAIEQRVQQGDICAILWSSPNNPAWVVLDDEELEGIGGICDRHQLLAIEDLAYFAMDIRQDYTVPGKPPFQPTVLRHCDRGISVISSSKVFSYAGQRIALALVSRALGNLEVDHLVPSLGSANVAHGLLHGVLYPLCACVPQTPQHGLLALLRAANDGDSSVFVAVGEYARRAAAVKPLFLNNGFQLVYDSDRGQPLADGFYFTVSYPGFEGGSDLLYALLHYGISAIPLGTTGSCRTEGLRACVSAIDETAQETLERRLAAFHRDHQGRRGSIRRPVQGS